MNKAFTLIELIAVIALLGIIGLLAIPTVVNLIATNKENVKNNQEKLIVAAAKDWANANPFSLPCPSETSCTSKVSKTVSELKKEGYLEQTLDSSYTGTVVITKENGKYQFEYQE